MNKNTTISLTVRQLPFGLRLLQIYRCMLSRCYSPKDISYRNYGGRGITVCDEWKNDFMSFYKWSIESGYIYEPRTTVNSCKKLKNVWSIDRIDVNGNYEPSNCRWADDIVQRRNQRSKSEWKEKNPHLLDLTRTTPPPLKISKVVICDGTGTHILTV